MIRWYGSGEAGAAGVTGSAGVASAGAGRRAFQASQPAASSAVRPSTSSSGGPPPDGLGSLMSRRVADEPEVSTGTTSTLALSLGSVPRVSPLTERMNG